MVYTPLWPEPALYRSLQSVGSGDRRTDAGSRTASAKRSWRTGRRAMSEGASADLKGCFYSPTIVPSMVNVNAGRTQTSREDFWVLDDL